MNYVKLNKKNIVTSSVYFDEPDEDKANEWLSKRLGGRWLRTDSETRNNKHQNGGEPFRGNFAGVGFYYDEKLDVFIPPKPYESWELDNEKLDWFPPIPYPSDTKNEDGETVKFYRWDEEVTNWVEVSREKE